MADDYSGWPEIRPRSFDFDGGTVVDLLRALDEKGLRPDQVTLGGEVIVQWTSPETPEENIRRKESEQRERERQAKSEQEKKSLEAWITVIGVIQKAAKEMVEKEKN